MIIGFGFIFFESFMSSFYRLYLKIFGFYDHNFFTWKINFIL